MDPVSLKKTFSRLTRSGFPEIATDEDGNEFTGTVSGLRADFATSLYGMGSKYKISFLMEYADPVPGADAIITLRGSKWVVLGVEKCHGISVRLDLREGF